MPRVVGRPSVDLNLRSGPQMREYEAIADRIAVDRPGRILDWGCGFGQLSHLMRARDLDVSAFEFGPELSESGTYPIEGFPDIEAYVETSDPVRLPYEDATFDAVLSCGVLEHVSDPFGSVGEIHRVLRPSGRFYVYKLPNRFSYLEAIAKRIGLYHHGELPDDRVYDRRAAETLVRARGFRVVEFRRTNMLPLTVGTRRAAGAIWAANRALGRVPGLNLLATNLELVVTRG